MTAQEYAGWLAAHPSVSTTALAPSKPPNLSAGKTPSAGVTRHEASFTSAPIRVTRWLRLFDRISDLFAFRLSSALPTVRFARLFLRPFSLSFHSQVSALIPPPRA
jgi:hypothetical protein